MLHADSEVIDRLSFCLSFPGLCKQQATALKVACCSLLVWNFKALKTLLCSSLKTNCFLFVHVQKTRGELTITGAAGRWSQSSLISGGGPGWGHGGGQTGFSLFLAKSQPVKRPASSLNNYCFLLSSISISCLSNHPLFLWQQAPNQCTSSSSIRGNSGGSLVWKKWEWSLLMTAIKRSLLMDGREWYK